MKLSVHRMSRIVMLSSLAIVLRVVFGAFPNVKPVTAIFLVCLSYLPFGDSFLVMLLTMVGSSLIFGYSLVVWWQVLSFAVILYCWKAVVLPLTRSLRQAVLVQSLVAAGAAFVYGFVISIPSVLQFGGNLFVYWLNGLVFDSLHAVSTALFYPIIYSLFRRFYHEKNDF